MCNKSKFDPRDDFAKDMVRIKKESQEKSREAHVAERANRWESIADEMVEDTATAIKKAKEIASRYPGTVSWRELLSLPPEI